MVFKNVTVAVFLLFVINTDAQVADSVRPSSAKTLIESENRKNLIPTSKNQPLLRITPMPAKPAGELKTLKQRKSKKEKRKFTDLI